MADRLTDGLNKSNPYPCILMFLKIIALFYNVSIYLIFIWTKEGLVRTGCVELIDIDVGGVIKCGRGLKKRMKVNWRSLQEDELQLHEHITICMASFWSASLIYYKGNYCSEIWIDLFWCFLSLRWPAAHLDINQMRSNNWSFSLMHCNYYMKTFQIKKERDLHWHMHWFDLNIYCTITAPWDFTPFFLHFLFTFINIWIVCGFFQMELLYITVST